MRMMHRTRRTPVGFTLIELLVVIAVIALLVSILVPSLALARELTGEKVCASNMRSLHIGLVCYAYENNDFYPLEPAEHNPHLGLMDKLISARLAVEDLFYCPQAYLSEDPAKNTALRPVGASDSVIHTEANAAIGNISYIYWSFAENKKSGGVTWREEGRFFPRQLKLDGAIAVDPARQPASANPQERWVLADFFRKGGPFPHARRHAGGLNIGYLDGHAALMTGRPQDNYK